MDRRTGPEGGGKGEKDVNGGVKLFDSTRESNVPTYICIYVLWERVDVRWEFYLVKCDFIGKRGNVFRGSWDVGGSYWSRYA
jgi:hypothetical protein